MSNQSGRIAGLDVLRSIAILCVLCCHFVQLQFPVTPLQANLVESTAVYGVELFFVLSGYLIGCILIRDLETFGAKMATLRNFWTRRWYRTLPNYYFYLLFFYLLTKPWHSGAPFRPAYLFFVQNFAWHAPDFFVVSWSLSIEEWFYFLFPLLLFALARVVHSRQRLFLTGIAIFLGAGFLLRLTCTNGENWNLESVRTLVVFRLDGIVFGVALAYLRRYHSTAWRRLCALPTMLVGLVAVACLSRLLGTPFYYDHHSSVSGILNALFYDALDLSCALILPWFSTIVRMKQPPDFCFRWISILSYSLYLGHEIAMHYAGGFLRKYGLLAYISLNGFLSLSFALLFAAATYFLIEKKFLSLRDRLTVATKVQPPNNGRLPSPPATGQDPG